MCINNHVASEAKYFFFAKFKSRYFIKNYRNDLFSDYLMDRH